MPSPRPRSRRALGLPVAGLVALTLSGCVGGPVSTPSPSSSESPAPIFESDEEALAAATAAYTSFESISQLIASEAGEQPERIAAAVTPAFLPELVDEFAQYQELGIRVEGKAVLGSFKLAEHVPDPESTEVTIYVCRDVSGVRVLDASGLDITPTDRDDRTPLIASLIAGPGESILLVNSVELWSGDDFC